MKPDQIIEIIKKKNEQRERQVGYDAEVIVEQILTLQGAIKDAQSEITKLQDNLRNLSAETINTEDVIKL